jgi:hypothetical protein
MIACRDRIAVKSNYSGYVYWNTSMRHRGCVEVSLQFAVKVCDPKKRIHLTKLFRIQLLNNPIPLIWNTPKRNHRLVGDLHMFETISGVWKNLGMGLLCFLVSCTLQHVATRCCLRWSAFQCPGTPRDPEGPGYLLCSQRNQQHFYTVLICKPRQHNGLGCCISVSPFWGLEG